MKALPEHCRGPKKPSCRLYADGVHGTGAVDRFTPTPANIDWNPPALLSAADRIDCAGRIPQPDRHRRGEPWTLGPVRRWPNTAARTSLRRHVRDGGGGPTARSGAAQRPTGTERAARRAPCWPSVHNVGPGWCRWTHVAGRPGTAGGPQKLGRLWPAIYQAAGSLGMWSTRDRRAPTGPCHAWGSRDQGPCDGCGPGTRAMRGDPARLATPGHTACRTPLRPGP